MKSLIIVFFFNLKTKHTIIDIALYWLFLVRKRSANVLGRSLEQPYWYKCAFILIFNVMVYTTVAAKVKKQGVYNAHVIIFCANVNICILLIHVSFMNTARCFETVVDLFHSSIIAMRIVCVCICIYIICVLSFSQPI